MHQDKSAPARQQQQTLAQIDPATLEKILLTGDLSELNNVQRLQYIKAVCESVGLNPLTKPFSYIKFDGRLLLYARKEATEQLRQIHNISVKMLDREIVGEDVYMIRSQATMPNGRTDEAIGAVPWPKNMTPSEKANAIMKAETKSKRRVTLSVTGLGMIDESEIETMAGAQRISDADVEREPPAGAAPAAPPTVAAPQAPTTREAKAAALKERMRHRDDVLAALADLRDQCMQLAGDTAGSKAFTEMLKLHGVETIDGFSGVKSIGDARIAALDIQDRIENMRESLRREKQDA